MKDNLRPKAIRQVITFSILIAIILFGSAGDLKWWIGWLFFVSYVILVILTSGLLGSKKSDLVKERITGINKAIKWDKILLPFLVLILPYTSIIIAGLDHRYNWTTSLTTTHQFFFFAFSIIGILITAWAMAINNFFSSVVRIQSDRGQTVVTDGPYKYVRHPGYVGAILYNISIPLMLGSLWAAIPGILEMVLFVVRTKIEDDLLTHELSGYSQYSQKVRYKLVPFVW